MGSVGTGLAGLEGNEGQASSSPARPRRVLSALAKLRGCPEGRGHWDRAGLEAGHLSATWVAPQEGTTTDLVGRGRRTLRVGSSRTQLKRAPAPEGALGAGADTQRDRRGVTTEKCGGRGQGEGKQSPLLNLLEATGL